MAIYVNGWIYKQESLEAIIRDLQSQLDAAMHKETAMCLELERERGRLDWYVEVGANINVHDGAEWQTVVVVDGNIRAAIDEAMEGGE